MTYRCSDGDRIDLIVLNHYGSLDRLQDVISTNQHLIKLPLDLTAGVEITLPQFDVTDPGNINVTELQPKERTELW